MTCTHDVFLLKHSTYLSYVKLKHCMVVKQAYIEGADLHRKHLMLVGQACIVIIVVIIVVNVIIVVMCL